MIDTISIISGVGIVITAGGFYLFSTRNQNTKIDNQDKKIDELKEKTFDPDKCELHRKNMELTFKAHVSEEMKQLKDELMPDIRDIKNALNIKSKNDEK